MTNPPPTFGSSVVAWVAVMVVRVPMTLLTGVVAFGVGLLADPGVDAQRAAGVAVVAWPLWALILVAHERYRLTLGDEKTTRLHVVGIHCVATACSLAAGSALFASGPALGLQYGGIVAALMCVAEILALTGGRPFGTDWRAPTACTPRQRRERS